MAFRATNTLPVIAYSRFREHAVSLRSYCQGYVAELNSDTQSGRILNLLRGLLGYRSQFTALASTPGLAQYARDQENDQGYDVVVEGSALITLVTDAALLIRNNFPVDGNGFLLAETFAPDGTRVERVFTPAQTVTIQAALSAIVAQIA
jgi:hypothetical protein